MNAIALLPLRSQDFSRELSVLFHGAGVGLAELLPTGLIIPLNPALERMLEVASDRTSITLWDLICSESRLESERGLRELFEGGRESFCFESRNARQNQSLRWIAWRILAQNGHPDAMLAIVEEDTDSQLEQRLRQAEGLQTMGRLAGGVAHDFNNLLTGVLLYCDLLLANAQPGHRLRKYAEEIRKAGLQASDLVRQLLAISRAMPSEPCLVSLNEIVEGMRHLLQRLIGEHIQLQLRLDPNLGLVRMDPTHVQQMLLNLILNARDALTIGGTIGVETGNCYVQVLPGSGFAGNPASLAYALLAVTDNGTGMDVATRAHLFELFFTTKGAGKGTGLGLATVHDIVTRNGGLIHVDSMPQKGTRFTVLLPLVQVAPRPQQTCETSNLAPEKLHGGTAATEGE